MNEPASRPLPAIEELAKHPQLLTFADVAAILRVSERHVQDLHLDGRLPKVAGLGRSVRFRPVDVMRFINANAPEVA